MLRQRNIENLMVASSKGEAYFWVRRKSSEVLEENRMDFRRLCRYTTSLPGDQLATRTTLSTVIKPRTARQPDHTLKLCDFGFARTVSHPGQQLIDYVATGGTVRPSCSSARRTTTRPWPLGGRVHWEPTTGSPCFQESETTSSLHHSESVRAVDLRPDGNVPSQPTVLGLKFPDMTRPETLQRKYVGKLTKRAYSMMAFLLRWTRRTAPPRLNVSTMHSSRA